MNLEVFGVVSERLLCPFWNKVNGLSVATDLLVKCRVLVLGEHLILLREVKFQGVDLLVASGCRVLLFQGLVENLDVTVHKLHTSSESLLLGL